MTVELDENAANTIRDVAAVLKRSPDKVASEVVANGMEMLCRYAAMKERAKTVNVEQVIQTLRSKRNDNPPDPGDEIPEDLKDWVVERRARYASIAPE